MEPDQSAPAKGKSAAVLLDLTMDDPCSSKNNLDCIPLAALRIGNHDQRIRVRASRVRHHRGALADGKIKELRVVFVDETGNSMYGIVPTNLVNQNIHILHESGKYELALFEVSDEQIPMNPVANPLIIIFTEFTVVQRMAPHTCKIPQWTYRLTPIVDLPEPHDRPRRPVDVIGVIRSISNIATLNLPRTNFLASRRHIQLRDPSGHEIRITLWGETAFLFNGHVVRFLSQYELAAVIFVGLTVEMHQAFYIGKKELSGASACRWYINRDIEELNILRVSLCASFRPSPNPWQVTIHATVPGDYPMKGISQFHEMNLDLLPNWGSLFRCVVTIWKITPGQAWWVACCTQCGRPTIPVESSPPQPETYSCSGMNCNSTEGMLQFRISVLGSDITGGAEFTLLGQIAQDMIGLSPEQAIRNNSADGVPITNIAITATKIRHMPLEIASITSWKYRFLIHVTGNSIQQGWPKFTVRAIEAAYPPE